MSFRRPVSANEELYLVSDKAFSRLSIQVIVRGKGVLHTNQIEQALQTVSNHIPGTRLRLHGREWIADAAAPKLTLLEGALDFDDIMSLECKFNPSQGYTCDLLLGHDQDQSLLVFRVSHAVMDGSGLIKWARAFFQVLRGEQPAPLSSTLTDDAALVAAPLGTDEPTIPRFRGPKGKPAPTALDYSYTKAKLVGSIPVLVSKLALGVQKTLGGDVRIMVPVDLRSRLSGDGEESLANLSIPVFATFKETDTPEIFAKTLASVLEKKTFYTRSPKNVIYRNLPRPLLGVMVDKTARSQIIHGRYFVSSVISQLERVDPSEFSTAQFAVEEVYMTPAAVPVAPFSMLIAKCGDATVICFNQSDCLSHSAQENLASIISHAGLKDFQRT